MADTTASPTSLRRLVPRIFSRAPRYADLSRLLAAVKANHPRGDIAIIEKAYQVAEERHRGQKRRSGEPYITHPLAVAEILAELGLGPKAIAAALLHDTVEDTGYPLEDLRAEFGDEVALLVDGVTKLDKVKYGESAQAETVRKMIVAMSKDIRVLVIKLADRLHNARTWGFVPPEKAKKKATETLEIYAPLAHRLGIQAIKSELEDLSFAVLYPKIFNEIDSLVKQRTPQREQYVQRVIDDVNVDLHELRIRGMVVGRPKQLYSVYQKMVVRGREFDDIYDLIGIRVIVSSVRDCYAVLGAIHARWTPLPGRFKDYIATPKFNLYRSLHTTVIGPGGRTVEIQIRTQEMHQQAEYGVAAHWKYKERMASGQSDQRPSDTDMAWVARLSDWQAETKDPGEFLDSLRFEIGAKEVYVFTPKGRVIGLPAGATPVDFGYAVHTEIGHRTMGAKVNGRLVPLDSQLNSGDVVEVFTSKNPDAGPSQDWLTFVKSSRARNKIRGWFTKERRDEAIEQGKEAIARAMRRNSMPLQNLKNSLGDVAHQLHLEDVSALYAAVGEGHVSTQSVLEKVTALHQTVEPVTGPLDLPPTVSQRKIRGGDSGVLVRGADDILVKLAKCCTPVPGDEIVGFITRGQGVSVHRADCTNVSALKDTPERMIDVEWAPTTKSVFLVQIQVEALDRAGLLSDITKALSEHHVNILSANVSTTRERLAISRYVFEMGDTVHLDRVLNAVRRIDGVYDVYRVTSS
ncbi:bifunctional (p)ppGpp synthetase/guanosine-3',5'-bis(diphosphate) 3'-pyrophosphohydrolase [Microbacterium betulae]|uniref:Bifunctional (P)ppGpp synthetase/guanosine-3',5'-bis(Diphosphate) 3'-pyrophosphohydrolase n=1 Tax=Microbacterium betulae TaxID=2981139 RepID=A0AA97I5I2_9MICO|nr:bifunctional (p)ppGpp synthetase/guanosine-3',5'-bis(diphosphate) 3'-pyrophosphohydrolase [Microbacterium sp. AB]WOF21542.1 bifunctional (p)ppGpp synthetase/guanosine-3',5'-bis(diphosphate) 3'-pyrophosphohydrolase [Microbacterium sp. AB]